MRCEKYRDALREAAAGPEDLNDRVRQHMAECSGCRATLREEQTLFARIDVGLRARMIAQPCAGFLADVRAQILQEPEPRSVTNPMWALAAVSAMVAVLAIAGPWVGLRKKPAATTGPTVSTNYMPSGPKAVEAGSAGAVRDRSLKPGRRHVVVRNADREPEVLVPPDEREALAKFVTHLRQRDEVAQAIATPQVNEDGKFSEIRPVEIARLRVKLLAWETWNDEDDRHDEEER